MADKLTTKEERFCHEFIKDFNATKAAERAKYSKKSARQIGSDTLSKTYIKNYIAELLEAIDMQEGEIKKRISDMARMDMADYMVKKQVPHTPLVKSPLKDVIQSRKEYVIREEIFCGRMGYTDDEFDKFQNKLNVDREQIMRMEIELEHNPNAYRIVEGETIMVEVAELDLVKIMDDSQRGALKSFKHTKDGIQVETYAADNALTTLAKFKGMLVEKSEVDLNANVETVTRIGYGNKKLD